MDPQTSLIPFLREVLDHPGWWGPALVVLGLAGAVGTLAWNRRAGAAEPRRRWLLLAVSPARAEDLAPALERAGWEVQILPDGTGLEAFLRLSQPSLVVLEQPRHGEAFLRLESRDAALASTPVLLLDSSVAMGSDPLRAWLPPGSRPREVVERCERLVSAVPGPRRLSRREEVEAEFPRDGLIDWLHFFSGSRLGGRLEVRGGGGIGWIWLEAGQIRHAVLGPLSGLVALKELLDLGPGTLSFRPGVAAPERSVRTSTLELLHQHAKERDEHAKNAGD